MIVIDCSALVYALTDVGPLGQRIGARIDQATKLIAPYLLDIEVTSALLGLAKGTRANGTPKLTRTALDTALAGYTALPILRVEHLPLLPRMCKLAANLSVYDTTYVALAELYKVPLVTSDAKIAKAKIAKCPIETFAP